MNDLIVHNQSQAISLWVQAKAYEMIVAGFTQAETAKAITEMGLGLRPGRLGGVAYPPDYKVSHQAVRKAFQRYCQRNPIPGLEEMRRIDSQRMSEANNATMVTPAALSAAWYLCRCPRLGVWSLCLQLRKLFPFAFSPLS